MSDKKFKIAINGFGRIGRSFFQVAFLRPEFLKCFGFLITFFIGLFIFSFSFAYAEELFDANLPKTPGMVSGAGVHFEITNSSYLNIVLDSSEEINLKMESMPEMVTMTIEPVSSAISTQITLSGFAPLTTYYKYQDDYHNLTEFIADNNGTYSYTQDLTTPHLVFIQPRKNTRFIKDDVTGGDCYLIGVWDGAIKTCTLTTDINETIQIDNDNIIFDGNSRIITGSGTGNGVYLPYRVGVVVKNLKIEKFVSGISLYASSGNILENNTLTLNSNGVQLNNSHNNTLSYNISIFNNYHGFIFYLSRGNKLFNNTASNHPWIGISLDYSDNNTLRDNTAELNNYYGIYLQNSAYNTLTSNITSNNKYNFYLIGWKDSHYYNNIDVTNLVDGKPIYYLKNINNQIYDGLNIGSFYLINSYNITIKNLTLSKNGVGIFLWKTNNSKMENTLIANNDYGIYFYFSNYNTSINNNFLTNRYGIVISSSNNNKIYNNNFIDNQYPPAISAGSGNIFNLSIPEGGNYWNNYDEPSEGCNDLNSDRICDFPYVFTGGQDNSPWKVQNGWSLPQNQPPIISNLSQYKSDGATTINEGGITTEDKVVFRATINDPEGDNVKLQIEIKEFNQHFDGTGIIESSFISSGSSTTVIRYGFTEGKYYWRARAVDDKGNTSDWQEFGTAGNIDFEVQLPLSLKAAKLAKLVIDAPYLGDGDTYGGKGWDPIERLYVNSDKIFTGYNYWNNKLRKIAFGAGLDCSGLTQWAYNYSFDPQKSLLRNTIRYDGADGQYKNNTETITETDLRPGDLLFLDRGNDNFIDHVAMYVGESDGYDIVEAYSPLEGIRPTNKAEFKTRIEFIENKHIRRVVLSPSLGGQVKAGSPIDLVVIDPDGFTITPTTAIQSDNEYLREIPGELYYTENLLGVDGRPEDTVYWPKQKTGDYIIKVLPEDGVSPTEIYALEFTAGEQSITLAQNMSLSQIPNGGYGITITKTGTIAPFIPVAIDIKPSSFPNSINLGSKGTTPVAIFGNNTFNIHQINLDSITLTDAPIKSKKNGQLMANYDDMNGDGFTDVVIHIVTDALQLTSSDVKAELNGFLFDGRAIKGLDSVRIVP